MREALVPAPMRARRARARQRAAEERRRERIARRRHALVDSDPRIRPIVLEDREVLGRVVDDFTAAGAAAHHLESVTAALCEAGVEYFLVPGRHPFRHVVGVHRADRKLFLEAMRERHRNSAMHAAKASKGTIIATSAYVDGALDEKIKTGLTIRFAEYLLAPDGTLLSGFDLSCDVEFWREGADLLEKDSPTLDRTKTRPPRELLTDSLVAPRRNRVADVLPHGERVPTHTLVQGRSHPTYAPFLWRLPDEVDFPVDVVYTWVDGADPDHAAKRARYRGGAASELAANASRFTDHEELRYSLRSLRMYAPFVRHVYVVTDGQVPAWMNVSAEGITVVDHRDIIEADALPTFNSHAIGARLHRIEGLSEHYLYLNDDVFVAAPVGANRFFHANGIARLPFSPHQFGVGAPHPEEVAPNSAGKNARALLEEDFGRTIVHKFKHVPHPQIRSVFRELEERHAEDIEKTVHSRFRSPMDLGVAATLHHHHALFTARAVPDEYRMRYVDIADDDAEERMASLRGDSDSEFFCLNDLDTPPEREEEAAQRVRSFLEARFPFPSRFEKVD